jgi:hypothetical protein
MYKHLLDQQNDYVGSLILFVLPQFEGLPKEKLRDFIKEASNLEFLKMTKND